MDITSDFDLGPLTWVKGEIDNALDIARRQLDGWNGTDTAPLQVAATHLHQVYGALQIVDLRGVSSVCEACEQLIAGMQADPRLRALPAAHAIVAAIQAMRRYLDELLAGAPHAELALAPVHRDLLLAMGEAEPAPSELFYPDLEVRAVRPTPEPALDEAHRQGLLRKSRRRYQQGLLRWLTGRDPQAGVETMRDALREVEQAAPGSAQYTFWWAATGLLDAIGEGRVETDFWLKRLLGRLDLQLKRLLQGSRQLTERLLRDVLYYQAVQAGASGRSAEVEALFDLRRRIPARPATQASDEVLAAIKTLRERLEQAKEHWLRFASGRADALPAMRIALTEGATAARPLQPPALMQLVEAMSRLCAALPGHANALQDEGLHLEMAATLLFAQNALEHYHGLGDEFIAQADIQALRLAAALDPHAAPADLPTLPLLDEFSRQAQEKLLLAQVTHEIEANLHQVETILDTFFRNPEERRALPLVPSLMNQVLGALNMLQLEDAAELAQATMARIETLSVAGHEVAREDLDWIADAVSSLGLYVEALRHGRNDPATLRALITGPDAEVDQVPSVEDLVEERSAEMRDMLGQWAEGADADAGRIREDLARLAEDADLIGDERLRSQADEALRALDDTASPDAVQSAFQGSAEPAPAGPVAPSPEAARLLDASSEEIDAEILGVYIAEAREVLQSIAERMAELHANVADHEALTTVRRGFHTLKGSGRMVGLHALGEIAWEVEQTLNLWLRDLRPANASLLAFIEAASGRFGGWVSELESTGHAEASADDLVAQARALRGADSADVPATATAVEAEAAPAADEREAEAAVGESITQVGTHSLPTPLFEIFAAEARQRLDGLDEHWAVLASSSVAAAWEAFTRSAHTLAGISRTTGFEPLADAAHRLELWAGEWAASGAHDGYATSAPADLMAALRRMYDEILAGHYPDAGAALTLPLPYPPVEGGAAEEAVEAGAETPEDAAGSQPGACDAVTDLPSPEDVARRTDGVPFLPDNLAASSVTEAPETEQTGWHAEPDPESESESESEPDLPVTAPLHAQASVSAQGDELDPELLPIFLAETEELLPRIGETLRLWRAAPDDAAPRQALQRALHTLKGSARMAGAMALGDETHRLESRLTDLAEAAPDAAFLESLEHDYDHLAELIERLRAPTPHEVMDAPRETAERTPLMPRASEDEGGFKVSFKGRALALDTLINETGEVSIARSRLDSVLSGYKQTASELVVNVERLRGQLRELEIQAETQMRAHQVSVDDSRFDPLEFDRYSRLQELTRLMAESVNDVATAQEGLVASLNEAESALTHQAKMTRSLQQQLMHIRMVPINSQAERFHRIVRQAAKETGHKARLHIEGGETELDRSVLDRVFVPLEHLLRNAVAHGIEAGEARKAAGKPEYGEIRLLAKAEGNEVALTLSDDGAGVDHARVRQRAEALGWIGAQEQIDDERLEAMLFQPGLSTADAVTQVAGRGIGLDVVKSEIAAMGGRVRLASTPGQGTRFVIRLPLTLAMAQVVLARAGRQTFALPANLVALVREPRSEEWQHLLQAGYAEFEGHTYPLHSLAQLTGQESVIEDVRRHTVLLLRAGVERVALMVDALQGNAEVVVKNIGPQLARIPGISGATVLGDGRVALILNPFALVERAPRSVRLRDEPVVREAQVPRIMVVDDSLTVRKITERLLLRQGYRVSMAKDGAEALEMLQDEMPDVMLLDIEMPRMDGFELTRHIRADQRMRALPIIMITSRTAEKHRLHAFELGVDTFMGKPYQDEALLQEIKHLLLARKSTSAG